MRIRSVTYFENNLNKNNNKKGAKNPSEVINEKIAEYFAEKKEKKVA